MKKQQFQYLDFTELQSRSFRPNASVPRAFLKWAGSKRFILKHIIEILPNRFNVYREPFLGSGSLFFLLRPRKAILSDSCRELIETFEAVRDGTESVLRYLNALKPIKRLFYHIRQNRSKGRFKRASEFIYLNKTCWNGLYRVNSSGQFNVPFGAKQPRIIADPNNLRCCAQLMSEVDVSFRACDFEENLRQAANNDLVYLDPPYVTSHNNNGFIEYNEKLFSWQDQVRLAKLAAEASDRGATIIISNANDARVLSLYKGFHVKQITRSSTLASDRSKRGVVTEAVIFSN